MTGGFTPRAEVSQIEPVCFCDAPHEMEEPVPCPGCKHWVELQETHACGCCRELFCRECLEDGRCAICREIAIPEHRSKPLPVKETAARRKIRLAAERCGFVAREINWNPLGQHMDKGGQEGGWDVWLDTPEGDEVGVAVGYNVAEVIADIEFKAKYSLWCR